MVPLSRSALTSRCPKVLHKWVANTLGRRNPYHLLFCVRAYPSCLLNFMLHISPYNTLVPVGQIKHRASYLPTLWRYRELQVTIVWVPNYKGIVGIEFADTAARQAASDLSYPDVSSPGIVYQSAIIIVGKIALLFIYFRCETTLKKNSMKKLPLEARAYSCLATLAMVLNFGEGKYVKKSFR